VIARQVRAALGLQPWDPVNPLDIARLRGMMVCPLSSFRETHGAQVARLLREDSSAFSALTVYDGSRSLIVFNDGHSPARQNANISHEVSHDALEHVARPVFDIRGCRDVDQDAEDEADWLGPALLVSEEAALRVAREGIQLVVAAELYGVSEQVMRFRLNVTAAYKRVA
jgi:Zn-dependent peptidase ImmA (M78 family)